MTHSGTSSKTDAKAIVVDAFLDALEHPGIANIRIIRAAVLALDARIDEEIKWNAPSFKLDDHFATFRLHPPENLQLVLHTGAKPKKPPKQFILEDKSQLVKWAAPDRCVINVGNRDVNSEHCGLVVGLVRKWLKQL